MIGCITAGAVLIAVIGFTGSYAAVQGLAVRKGFGWFSYALPVGVDVGIAVLLALDLVLTWLRIPFPLLRQTAWLLTAATIVFNAASAWGDLLAVAMHAIIPVLFVVVVEAARHAVGRLAAISVDKHMESVRLVRWILSPLPTFRLWRRMKLWELRSYEQVVSLEQARVVYRARLRATYGRRWRRRAPVELLLPLKLARYGVPLPELTGAESVRVHALDPQAEDAPALAAASDLPATAKITELTPEAAGWAAFAAAEAAAAEAAEPPESSGNFPEVRPAAGPKQMATAATCAPVEVIAEPLLTSESSDLVDSGETDTTVADLRQSQPKMSVPEPELVVGNLPTSTPEPEPEPVLSAMELASRARRERQRQTRADAAVGWWVAQQLPGPPSLNEHAKASGISVPTLRKALAEFPQPEPEVVP
ncbi:DUF2637 domain-containing protein [Streptacidiphilus sp. PB12-B1b]|nr:DUF2637 domain-containing protein [Streptacidiphilus sp. PB12-B1b]